jgi:N-methylhydantoinase B
MGYSGNHPVEFAETDYPVRVEEYALVTDTGGPGTYRGGLALKRVTHVLSDQTMTLVAERSRVAAYGINGGAEGALAQYGADVAGGHRPLFSKTDSFGLAAGNVVTIQPAGGGGFGDPLERDPALVAGDLRNEYVSRQLRTDASRPAAVGAAAPIAR